MAYPCTSCGLCCRKAGKVVEQARELLESGPYYSENPYVQEVAAFPFPFDESGRCSMLAADNTCMVYDTRPDICNIDRTFEKYHSKSMSKGRFYEDTVNACNSMMIEAGVDPKFQVKWQDQ